MTELPGQPCGYSLYSKEREVVSGNVGIEALYDCTGVVHEGVDISQVYPEVPQDEQHLAASADELGVGAGEHPEVVAPHDIVIADQDVPVPLHDVVIPLHDVIGAEGTHDGLEVGDHCLNNRVEDVALGVEHTMPVILSFEETG
jgi:hypothetical protein